MNLWIAILIIQFLIPANRSCLPQDNLNEVANNNPYNLNNKSNYTIIDNLNSCFGPNSNFICYHNGKCISKYSYLNVSHMLRSYYCVCDRVS